MNYFLSVLAIILIAIPLIVKFVSVLRSSLREKNWPKVLSIVMTLMEEAEAKFADGVTKKEWVLAMVKASADTVDYDIDMDAISKLIDDLCNMSKIVNASVGTGKEGE